MSELHLATFLVSRLNCDLKTVKRFYYPEELLELATDQAKLKCDHSWRSYRVGTSSSSSCFYKLQPFVHYTFISSANAHQAWKINCLGGIVFS